MTQRVDDKTISDEDILWRRIANVPQLIKPLPGGAYRVSSAAFKDGVDGEVSVHLARLTSQEKALADHPEKGLVEIVASLPRSLGHIVVSDPEIDDPSHALICPPKDQSSKSRLRDARKMAEESRWLVYPLSIRS
jgi:hypothetical protein